MDREQYLQVYRHSLSHILAKAVIEMFGKENVQYAIGPQIADGFYYDFMLPRTVGKDDFKEIEDRMRDILKRKEPWERIEVSKAEALEMFKNQKYKTETIVDLPDDETITIYKTGDDFTDLCRGPHVDNSQELLSAAFKIKSVSGSYWKGDEHNDQLQRIYVYAFPSKQELKAHIDLVKEAMERDHKKLGPELDLFMFDPTAPGMPYWLPRGWKLFNALLEYWRGVHELHGYTEIAAPVINNKEIWEMSGHWGHYRQNMFCIQEDGEDYWAVKPMNCPNAVKVYQRDLHSYKDLPVRLNEVDVIHRKEKSGELNGLFRVQEFRQDDAHNLIREDQIEEEIHDIMSIADEIYSTLGLTYRAELSTLPDDFMGEIETWNRAEADLIEVMTKKDIKYNLKEKDGAFYGPKIDVNIKDSLGRSWQVATIQLDFQLPGRFGTVYVDKDGQEKTPVMIHAAVFGSYERMIGMLLEHFAGRLPLWLAPVQVKLLPIADRHGEWAQQVADKLTAGGVRVEIDNRSERLNAKIRDAQVEQIPLMLIIGDQEVKDKTVSVRRREDDKKQESMSVEEVIKVVSEAVK